MSNTSDSHRSQAHWLIKAIAIAFFVAALLGICGIHTYIDDEKFYEEDGKIRLKTGVPQWKGIAISILINVLVAAGAALAAIFGVERFVQIDNQRHREEITDALKKNAQQNTLLAVVETLEAQNRVLSELQEASTDKWIDLKMLPWGDFFNGTTKVYFVSQGWDGWTGHTKPHLEQFIKRGGEVHVVVPPETCIHMKTMASRLGTNEQEQQTQINRTIVYLEGEFSKHNASNKLFSKRVVGDRMVWTCMMYFEPHKLVISTFQYQGGKKVYSIDAPSFLVNTDQFPDYRRWFEQEWEFLTGEKLNLDLTGEKPKRTRKDKTEAKRE